MESVPNAMPSSLPARVHAARFVADIMRPRAVAYAPHEMRPARITAIIPTYKPPLCILDLVRRLVRDPLIAEVIVVDDATPPGSESVFREIERVATHEGRPRARVVRSPRNLQRAGAVNVGLASLSLPPGPLHYILVLDDDVSLEEGALEALAGQLQADAGIGAVCTQARVANRHENILTRLQGLEYVGFNVARIADRGYLYGPLIMHGLASLIRSDILIDQAKGYDRTQLLEDYDLTVRIKSLGYHVALAEGALATTIVPASVGQLWRQRIRWQYGGMCVIKSHWRCLSALLPDMISHALTIILYTAVITSMIWHTYGNGESDLITVVRVTSLATSLIFYVFQLVITFALEKGRDRWDIALRALLIPEFLYAVSLSFVLLGSYIFFSYTMVKRWLVRQGAGMGLVMKIPDKLFAWFGFTTTWGTK